MNEAEIWSQVRGIDSDGPTLKKYLDDWIAGRLTPEYKEDVFTDFSRDYAGSTAGYAAIPTLLKEGYPPQLAYDFAVMAGFVLAYGAMQDNPLVPEYLMDRTGEEARKLTITRLRTAIAEVNLTMFELVHTVALIAALDGRNKLHDKLEEAARWASVIPRDQLDENGPAA